MNSIMPTDHRATIFWGYSAQLLNIGAGLILLPGIAHYLTKEDVGLWFVFLSISALAQLLEFGFQSTLTRNASYIFAGASSLLKVGIPERPNGTQKLALTLYSDLIAASRLIYQIIAIAATLVLMVCGGWYISTLVTSSQSLSLVIIAWSLFAAGNIFNFYYGYVNALLIGRGSIVEANKATIASRLLMIVLGGAALINQLGLLGLGAAMLISSMAARFLSLHFFKSDPMTRVAIDQSSWKKAIPMTRILWHNAGRIGIVQLGTFLVQRGSIFIASSFLGLAAAGSYGVTLTVLMTLSAVSMAIVQIRLPYLARAQASNDRDLLCSTFGELILFGWSTYIIGLIFLLGFGAPLLAIVSTSVTLLPMWQLILFGIVVALELNHSIAACYLTTSNTVPFVRASLISGMACILLGLALVHDYQVAGLIAAQGIVQISYNNWKWPRMVRLELGFTWVRLVHASIFRAVKMITNR